MACVGFKYAITFEDTTMAKKAKSKPKSGGKGGKGGGKGGGKC